MGKKPEYIFFHPTNICNVFQYIINTQRIKKNSERDLGTHNLKWIFRQHLFRHRSNTTALGASKPLSLQQPELDHQGGATWKPHSDVLIAFIQAQQLHVTRSDVFLEHRCGPDIESPSITAPNTGIFWPSLPISGDVEGDY